MASGQRQATTPPNMYTNVLESTPVEQPRVTVTMPAVDSSKIDCPTIFSKNNMSLVPFGELRAVAAQTHLRPAAPWVR